MAGEGLDAIFSPRSIAIVGASRHPGKIGYEILRNLIVNEYQGILYPVNPNAKGIHGIRAYPSILDVPESVDLAVITVPADFALEAAEACGKKGVKGLVVITAGFREVGGIGIEREARLLALCHEYQLTMIGPNCMGVINTHPDVRMDATFAPTPPLRGGISLVTQSGALGIAILEHAKTLGVGFAKFCSLGNKAQVSLNDLLQMWRGDPDTKIILAYIENFGNPKNFVQIARATTKDKPIIAVKSGRSEAGSRAAASHTGSLGGSDLAAEAVFAQTGVLRAASIEELFDVARAVWQSAKEHAKPVLCSFLGRSENSPGFVELVSHSVPSYLFPESAARSLAAMYRYAQYRDREEGELRTFSVNRTKAETILDRVVREGRLLLRGDEADAVLEAYGIRTAKTRIVRRIEDLGQTAEEIGYPVVLKAVGPEIVHKSDLQAVQLGIQTEKQLVDAASAMEHRLRDRRITVEGFLLQEFVRGGMEGILGMARDKVYGPFLVFGLGGIYVEYLKDVSFGLPPLTDRDARRMIESIRTYPILRGVRGEPPRDVTAIEEGILRLGALVSDFDSIQELDLNPVLALEEGHGYRVVDARILLRRPSREEADLTDPSEPPSDR